MMNDDALVENQRILSAIESVDNATSANPLDGFQKTERNDNNSSPKMRARTAMLQGPILSTIVKLALPTIVVLLVQTLVGVAEVYYVGLLGVVALAGTALVFPFWSLMTMVSNGGMGSGVSSAIARAIGADRHDDADALVFHGLVLAIVLGLFFSIGAWLFGPTLFSLLGGRGEALGVAIRYSRYIFAGSIPIWVVSLLTSALRGAGNMRVPAVVTLTGAVVLIPASPALIFGFGPVPRFGVAGAGIAIGSYYTIASLLLLRYMTSGRSGLKLTLAPLQWRLFADILRVGLLSTIAIIQTNLTVIAVTGAFGVFGIHALAGYGIASRLDYFLIPVLFGLGTALLTMTGVNIGAGHVHRARRIAWMGGGLGALIIGPLGLVIALYPNLWLHLFSHEAAVILLAAIYLRRVAPVYGLLGFGFSLGFASQGSGHMFWPFAAGTSRLLIAAGLGWLAVAHFGAGIATLSLIGAAAIVVDAFVCSIPMFNGSFGNSAST
ncbi:MATE family efflux transporter [Terriglobus saanensis]|uniref:MATE efflux family protein n=1 Tax=Terriglobus saanensis (strain ATCC BAA-1853 / DSM 23119 / SP1PR4) TaxID=401053 RepID=E8V7B7_TERSS|nr:MATE family efflux transporter [Terriglobus saanensis]ADV82830.1 MATE efflux family protein [Terriglobus saanensis SP1PR4]